MVSSVAVCGSLQNEGRFFAFSKWICEKDLEKFWTTCRFMLRQLHISILPGQLSRDRNLSRVHKLIANHHSEQFKNVCLGEWDSRYQSLWQNRHLCEATKNGPFSELLVIIERGWGMKELLPHIRLISKVISLKLFLDHSRIQTSLEGLERGNPVNPARILSCFLPEFF